MIEGGIFNYGKGSSVGHAQDVSNPDRPPELADPLNDSTGLALSRFGRERQGRALCLRTGKQTY